MKILLVNACSDACIVWIKERIRKTMLQTPFP